MTSKQAEERAREIERAKSLLAVFGAEQSDVNVSTLVTSLDAAHAAGRKEIEEKLNSHQRSFLRMTIERDEWKAKAQSEYERGRREVIAEVMPTIEFYASKDFFIYLGINGKCHEDSVGNSMGNKARALKEKLTAECGEKDV